ncbi:hypothetical protein ASE23_23225 [Rhizobium sp. Root73]|nr:hypothetical protein ASD36_22635 [Rhizobium sp. Root1334]KRC11375.1 hypothetical protein ASE23_23225 [Rhizobium sp. Root73]
MASFQLDIRTTGQDGAVPGAGAVFLRCRRFSQFPLGVLYCQAGTGVDSARKLHPMRTRHGYDMLFRKSLLLHKSILNETERVISCSRETTCLDEVKNPN